MAKENRGYSRDSFLKHFGPGVDNETTIRQRLTEPSEALVAILNGDSLSYKNRISVSTKMGWLRGYYEVKGAVVCFSDPNEGWRLIKRGMLYDYWDTRITWRVRDFWTTTSLGGKKEPAGNARHLSVEAALGLAILQPAGMWYLERLEQSLSDESFSWSVDDFFTAYMVRLYRKLKRESDIMDIPRYAQEWEHPFNDLIDCWDDEEKLAEAIRWACDYHLRWNHRGTENHRAEFEAPVAVLNPVEIHALEAVRAELGLPTPKVEHELLQPPFYPIPESAKNITAEEILAEDDLLRRIVEMNQTWCDGLEE